MADLTTARSGAGTNLHEGDAKAPSTHGLLRAMETWTTWWRRDVQREQGSPRNVQQPVNGAVSKRNSDRIDLTTTYGPRAPSSTTSTAAAATQPVLVRSYSGSKSRRSSGAAYKTKMPDGSETDSCTPTRVLDTDAKLPSIDDFKFTNLLLASPSPDISHAIDAIAEICARSRFSLADEYGAHLPPFSHTLPPMPRTRGQMQSQREVMRLGLGKLERTLTTVPETSSNSECSSPSTSSRKSGHSAYGELTKVLRRSGSGSASKEHGGEIGPTSVTNTKHVAMLWQGKGRGDETFVLRVASPKISPETATTADQAGVSASPDAVQMRSRVVLRARSESWFGRVSQDPFKSAEDRLKDLLKTSAPG